MTHQSMQQTPRESHDGPDGTRDLEVGDNSEKGVSSSINPSATHDVRLDIGEMEVTTLRRNSSILSKMRVAELWLDKKLKFEPMGIERIPEDKRQPPNIMNMMLLWFSLLMGPGMITVTALGPLIGLSVADSIITTVIATVVASCLPALTATLSPLTGLRQVAVSRFTFGIQGAKLCGALNIVVNVGYGVIGCILAGQLLRAVSGGSLDISVGIVIIAVLALAVSFLGFHVLHRYESIAWVLIFILLIVQWAQAAKYFPSDITYHDLEGTDYVGAGLTYFAIIFGQCVAWCSITGDYCVHYPANVSKWKVFALTWAGLSIPTIFVGVLGCYIGGAIMTNQEVGDLYITGGFGAVILGTLNPTGFAKFACVIYALSCLSNLAAVFYSSALSMQLFGDRFLAVPRFVWVLVLTGITLALALGGRNNFADILTNLLPILGYWTICFGLVVMMEHWIFRPKLGGYDLEGWRDAKRTPVGIAAVSTLLTCVGLSFLGMNQTWFSGPLAKDIGAYGGDVGDYVVIVVAVLMYPIGRYVEIKYIRR